MGITNIDVDKFEVVVPIVRSASLSASTPTGNIVIPLHPLWPNLARTSATGPDGITAPIIDGGRGTEADIARKMLRGSIVVMDWNSNMEWLTVPEFGGKAVIFRAGPKSGGVLARNKFLTVPADIPRYYVEEKDVPLLNSLPGNDTQQVTVKCDMAWEKVTTENILARICGGDTQQSSSNPDKSPIVFQTYYDSISVVPDLSPGAEQACNPAVMLELARFILGLPEKPDRPVYVLFSGGHGQALAGITHFVRRLKEGVDSGWKTEEPGSLLTRMGKPALFVELDLASHSDRFGVFAYGKFRSYRDSQLHSRFTAMGLKLADFAKKQCPLLDPVTDLPCFVDAINAPQGRGWSTYFPYPPAFESELANMAGIPGITLATINDDRNLVDTPDDRVGNINFDLLNRQLVSEPGRRIGIPTFALALSFWKGPFVLQDVRTTLARIRGRILWLDQKKDYTPSQPLAKTLVFIKIPRGDKYLLGTRGMPVAMSDASGSFEFDGMIDVTAGQEFMGCTLEAYGLASQDFVDANPAGMDEFRKVSTRNGSTGNALKMDGSIIYAVDMANRLCKPFDILPGDQDLNLVVFPSKTITLYGLTDPRGYLPLTDLQVLEVATQSPPFQYGQSRTDHSWGVSEANCITFWADPAIRVRLTLGLGFQEKRLVLLNNTAENPIGNGFVLGELDSIPSMVLQGARDMWNLDESRLLKIESHGVNAPMVRNIHTTTGAYLKKAEISLASMDYRQYRDMSERLWSLESKAYLELRDMSGNMIKGVMFYLALLLPFSYVLERLLFASVTVRQRITWMLMIFIGSFAVLAVVHPAFRFTMTPAIVLLAFVILALAVTVMSLLTGKFDTLLKEQKHASGGIHEDAQNTGNVLARALDLGVANIRRRPQRGFLTAMTIVLVTFTLLSFTSLVPESGISTLRHPTGNPVYAGLLSRQRNWTPLPNLACESLKRTFQTDTCDSATNVNSIAIRAWFYSDDVGKLSQIDIVRPRSAQPLVAGGKNNFTAVALLCMEASEPAVTGVDKSLTAGRWFKDESDNGIILPSHIANYLGLGTNDIGSVINVYGHELPLIGIINEKTFDAVRDIDGEQLTPVNFVVKTQVGGSDVSAKEQSDTLQEYKHYSLDQVAIVPLKLGRHLGAGIRSVAIRTGPAVNPADAARDYAARANQAVLASDGKTVTLYSSVDTMSFAAAGQIGVPVLLGFIMVLGTMMGSVYERRREIFVYNSVGLSPTNVASLFLAESAVYAILGAGLGYLLGQLVSKLLLVTGALSGLGLNYSAGTTVLTTVFTMLIVLLSTIYPARQAFIAAMPATVSNTDTGSANLISADTAAFYMPFVAMPDNIFAMQAYMHEYLDGLQGVTIGRLAVDNLKCGVETVAGKPVPILRFRAWLAPFDIGVCHDAELRITYREDRHIYQYHLSIVRFSGDQQNWRRLVPGFATAIRKQLLMWRVLPAYSLDRYTKMGQKLFACQSG
ncbi:MAG: FtsX-like permease family protein [bacterium]